MKVEVVESAPKSRVCEGKGKGLVAEHEDHLSQDEMEDIDEHLNFLSRSECLKPDSERKKFEPVDYKKKYFELLKQKERAFITQENDWVTDGVDEDEETSYVILALMAKSDEAGFSSSSYQIEEKELASNEVQTFKTTDPGLRDQVLGPQDSVLGDSILDQPVCITNWGKSEDEFNIWNRSSWKLEDESSETHVPEGNRSVPSAGEAVSLAQDVVKSMVSKGYVLGVGALSKEKSFNESHQVSETATIKVAELSERIGLTDKIYAGVGAVKSVDERYHIYDTTKSAVAATVVSKIRKSYNSKDLDIRTKTFGYIHRRIHVASSFAPLLSNLCVLVMLKYL
ncbi:hypothetical protein AgCh_004440 [Apium graveolens]